MIDCDSIVGNSSRSAYYLAPSQVIAKEAEDSRIYNEYFRDKGFGKGFLDVHDTQNGIIYDFKFGKAQMSNKQYNKYHNTFSNDQIIIVKPK
jgi:hypothetical protein